MMQELVAKMSGQEQDWKKILDRLLTEMDNKVRAREGPRASPDQDGATLSRQCRFPPPTPPRPAPRELTGLPRSWTAWSWTP